MIMDVIVASEFAIIVIVFIRQIKKACRKFLEGRKKYVL